MPGLLQLVLTLLATVGVMALGFELFGVRLSVVRATAALAAATLAALVAGLFAAVVSAALFARDPLAAGVTAVVIVYPVTLVVLVWWLRPLKPPTEPQERDGASGSDEDRSA